MGEMADYALEQVWEMEDLYFRHQNGEIDDHDAYDMGLIDEMGGSNYVPWTSKSRGNPVSKTCGRCGCQHLSWMQVDSKWVLGRNGVQHSCTDYNNFKFHQK